MAEPMPDGRPRRAVRRLVAVAVVVLAIGALLWFAGVMEVVVTLAELRVPDAATVVATGLLPLVLWGIELRVVLAAVDGMIGPSRAVALFLSASFLNNATPFGEVGGAPPSGLLIAGVRRITFERGLAAIVAVNAINRVAVLVLGALGLALLEPDVGGAGGGWSPAVGLAVWTALLGGLLLAWLYRAAMFEALGPPLAAAVARLGRGLPLVPAPSAPAVEARIRGFVGALERLAEDPHRFLAALVLGVAGHLAVAATLWLAVDALGVPASLPAVLVVIPLARLSGLSPTPGGAGSAVVLLAGLLVAVAGVPAAEATAAALIYRAAAFWVPTAIGGVATVGFLGRIVPE